MAEYQTTGRSNFRDESPSLWRGPRGCCRRVVHLFVEVPDPSAARARTVAYHLARSLVLCRKNCVQKRVRKREVPVPQRCPRRGSPEIGRSGLKVVDFLPEIGSLGLKGVVMSEPLFTT